MGGSIEGLMEGSRGSRPSGIGGLATWAVHLGVDGMRASMSVDMRANMCIDMCIDMRTDVCV